MLNRSCQEINHLKGFTLVEVLVVSVIVGILAAVAIPVYTGYVNNMRQEVVKNIAGSAAAAANIYFRRTSSLPVCHETTVPSCKILLNIFLTEPANYSIDIQLNTVTVIDLVHSGHVATANF
jgi:prepilin-type N-terminal cleavage/methylation domain-containing protein